jgi:hypothetical protein
MARIFGRGFSTDSPQILLPATAARKLLVSDPEAQHASLESVGEGGAFMSGKTQSERTVDPLKRRLRWPFQSAQSVLGVPLVFQDDEHADIFSDYFTAMVDELDKVLSNSGATAPGTIRQWMLKLSPEQQCQLILGLFSGPVPDFFASAGKVLESHKTHFGEKAS